eukprot:TRINITY_DN66661_c12_g3_i1.p1 TRINITY_DN66661_c12_g3~~TRINITY_DN66661_c12_g3_i1.p1  ORF type:complete len:418 (+),score=160.88 TRINITY_DN66661_c12_g3_i1:156-1256(+)
MAADEQRWKSRFVVLVRGNPVVVWRNRLGQTQLEVVERRFDARFNERKHPLRLFCPDWRLLRSGGVDVAFEADQLVFLGTHKQHQDMLVFAIAISASQSAQLLRAAMRDITPENGSNNNLSRAPKMPVAVLAARAVAAYGSAAEAALLATALDLIVWNRRNLFCGWCGERTRCAEAGVKRQCSSDKGRCRSLGAYPRTDPVVIMCIEHPDGQHVLLGRKPTFPKSFYSCLAGFVSPGESLEEAVTRESFEEAGIVVPTDTVRYFSSQPWPFGGSQLMVGMMARASTTDIDTQNDDELEDARWVHRRDIIAALRASSSISSFGRRRARPRNNSNGNGGDHFVLPPPLAIAHKLLLAWAHRAPTVSRL